MKKIRRIQNLIVLSVFLGSNFLAPLSYAIDDLEMELESPQLEIGLDSFVVSDDLEIKPESQNNIENNNMYELERVEAESGDLNYLMEDENDKNGPQEIVLPANTLSGGSEEQENILDENISNFNKEEILGIEEVDSQNIKNDLSDNQDEDENIEDSELDMARKSLNINPIIGTDKGKKVIVNVEAPTGTFPEGTKLTIEPITKTRKLNQIRDQIIDVDDTVEADAEVVAFDISFIYILSGGEEVELQPKEGKTVKVSFNYEGNKQLLKADKNDEQEVKVFHFDDKSGEGNKVKEGEEVVTEVKIDQEASENFGEVVLELEGFSTYVVTIGGTEYNVRWTENIGVWSLEGNGGAVNSKPYGMLTIGEGGSAIRIMDRNLGASDVWTYTDSWGDLPESDIPTTYGYYYQFGNNYGFMPNTSVTLSSDSVNDVSDPYSSDGVWHTNQPWTTLTLWGGDSGTESQRQGPCPAGWHVPSISEWQSLHALLGNTTNGKKVSELLKLPPAGYREMDSSFNYAGTLGYYWSSSPNGNDGGSRFYLQDSNIATDQVAGKSFGFSVRCFRNTSDAKIVTFILDGKTVDTKQADVEGKVLAPDNIPEKEGAEWKWYIDDHFGEVFDIENRTVVNDMELYGQLECKSGYVDNGYECVEVKSDGCPEGMHSSESELCECDIAGAEIRAGQCTLNFRKDNVDYYPMSTNLGYTSNYPDGAIYKWGATKGLVYTSTVITSGEWDVMATTDWSSNSQGPCPEGYHVPTGTELKKMTTAYGGSNAREKMENMVSALHLPLGGYRDVEGKYYPKSTDSAVPTQSAGTMQKIGLYFGSTKVGSNETHVSIIDGAGFYTRDTSSQLTDHYGGSVRCFKNSNEKYITIHGNGGEPKITTAKIENGNIEVSGIHRDGYILDGYTRDSEGLQDFDEGVELIEEGILYAKWKLPDIRFTDDVSSTYVQMDTITIDWGDAVVKKYMFTESEECSENSGDYEDASSPFIIGGTEEYNGKYICIYAEDSAGNVMTGRSENTIHIDVTTPEGTIQINNGSSYASNAVVNLTLNAIDTGAGMGRMKFSCNGVTWSELEDYTTSKSWDLNNGSGCSAGDGEKTVYVRYYDLAGNIVNKSATITLDTVSPSGLIVINDGDEYTNNAGVRMTLNAVDTGAGMGKFNVSCDGVSWMNNPVDYKSNDTWTFKNTYGCNPNDGVKTLYIKYIDNAGNETVVNDSIILDRVNPAGSVVINDGDEYTKNTGVRITLNATDTGAGMGKFNVSCDGVNWMDNPVNYRVNDTWTFKNAYGCNPNDGVKTLYIKYIDNAGNETVVNDSIILDRIAPDAMIVTTHNLKSDSQIATLSCTDGVEIAKYYRGIDSNPADDQYIDITSTTNFTTGKMVNAAGIYYLYCKDSAGNTSNPISQTYYSYSVHNMLNVVSKTEGIYNTTNYQQSTAANYIAPEGMEISFANIYSAPTYSSVEHYKGYTTLASGNPSTSATTELDSNSIYYLWFDRVKYNLSLVKNTGISSIYYKTNGAESYSSTSDSLVLQMKAGSDAYVYAVADKGYSYSTTSLEDPTEWANVAESHTFSPVSSIINYNITYVDSLHVSNNNPTNYNVTTMDVTLTDLSKDGYTFLGWYLDAEMNNKIEGVAIQQGSTGEKTFYAKWSDPINYSIEYNLNGGSISSEKKTSYTVEDSDYTLLIPSRSGYTFVGWTGSNGNVAQMEVTIPHGSIGDKSYTAAWTANTNTAYTVKHWKQNLNDSEYTEVSEDEQHLTGTTDTLTVAAAKSYEGFTPKSFVQQSIAGDESTVVNIYYDRNKYTVTFVDEDGTTVLKDAVEYVYGTKGTNIDKPDDPTKTATKQFTYIFAGWDTIPATITENIILKATYTSNYIDYTVIWKDYDGKILSGTTYHYNDNLVVFSSPSRVADGIYTYTFKTRTPNLAEKVTENAEYTAEYDVSIKTSGKGRRKSKNIEVEKNHASAGDELLSGDGDVTNVDNRQKAENNGEDVYDKELIDAYNWAYSEGITNKSTIEKAEIYDGITREQLAKMMVEFMSKVLGKKPLIDKVVKYNDVSVKERGQEAYDYIQLAYQYQILGIDAKGNPIKQFNPSGIVTRAEFATVLSRALYGNKNNQTGAKYYEKHIQALKDAGILTNTDAEIKELRGWIMLMLYRSLKTAKER